MDNEQDKKDYKVLFVDDSHAEIIFLKLLFEVSDMPAEAMFITSSTEALEILDTCESADFPDCIMVDINMPLLNGFEFVEQFENKIRPNSPNTKLFMYSTSINSQDIEKAKSFDGVEDFIQKPFNDEKFNNFILPTLSNSPPNAVKYAATAPS